MNMISFKSSYSSFELFTSCLNELLYRTKCFYHRETVTHQFPSLHGLCSVNADEGLKCRDYPVPWPPHLASSVFLVSTTVNLLK